MNTLVLYPPNNLELSLIAQTKLKDAEYIPLNRGDTIDPETMKGRDVYILDLNFKYAEMEGLMNVARKLVWLAQWNEEYEDWTEGYYPLGKVIVSSKGEIIAWVDPEDFAMIIKYTWFRSARVNVQAYIGGGNKNKVCKYMQHLILEKKDGFVVDHINRNPSDNRRCNLRYATLAQNRTNSSGTTQGYKGVEQLSSCFRSRIMVNNHIMYIGTYNTAIEAAKSYDKAARIFFGAFARTNFNQREPFPPTTHVVLDRNKSCAQLLLEYKT